MKTPDVSVVMSVHNGAGRVAATIDSILSQRGVDLEFVIVNDGSTDRTGEILEAYALRDGRVRLIYQENTGLTQALVNGCAAARGAYIARQDAGDVSLPDRLRSQKTVLDQNKDCVFVSCWTRKVGPGGEPLSLEQGRINDAMPRRILSEAEDWGVIGGPAHHSSVMFRKNAYEAAGGYRSAFQVGQDWDLWYRLAEIGAFVMIPRVLCEAVVAPDSISTTHRNQQAAFAALSRKALALRLLGRSDGSVLQEAELLAAVPLGADDRRKMAALALYFVGRQLFDRWDRRSIAYFVKALKADPLNWRPVAGLVLGVLATAFRRSARRKQ